MHPEIAGRSCEDCVRFVYDDTAKVGGKLLRDRRGEPKKRPQGAPTPCLRCPKIPAGVTPIPSNAAEWSEREWRIWTYHRECRAVGRFPDDAIVRRHAGIIEGVLEDIRDQRAAAGAELLHQLAGLKAVTG